MKKAIAVSVMALAFSCVSAFATGQDDQSAPQHPPMAGHDHGEHMVKALGLTEDQQAQLKQHHEQQRAAMEALKADTSLTKEQKHAKMKDMHAENEQFMEGLLTPEQKTKWEQMKQQHHMHEHPPQAAAQPQA